MRKTDFFSNIFSGDPGDLSRISPVGLIVTAAGLLMYLILPRVFKKRALALRFASLLVVALGALMTMKIIG